MKQFVRDLGQGLIGTAVGGFVGYLLMAGLAQRFNAPVLVGAFAGLGCGLLSQTDSNLRGLMCAVLSLVAGLLAQWKQFTYAFTRDGSLGEFVTHLHQIPPATLALVGLGGFLGFWWGREWTLRPRTDQRPSNA